MANDVEGAARLTLRSDSARVARSVVVEPAGLVAARDEGVTDFGSRRTWLRLESEETDEWARRFAERWPWLAADDEEDEGTYFTVFAEKTAFFGDGERWSMQGDRAGSACARHPADPVWIIETLQAAHRSAPGPTEPVRGVPCTPWSFRVEPAGPPLTGTCWIDQDGRIRRVRWREIELRRPRLPRRAERALAVWTTTELWDFGVEASVEVPAVERDRTPWPVDLAWLALRLWRRKRSYERGAPVGGGEAPAA